MQAFGGEHVIVVDERGHLSAGEDLIIDKELHMEHDRRTQRRHPGHGEQVACGGHRRCRSEQGYMAASSAADRAAVTANLASFRCIGITRPGLRAASVAVCVLMRQDVSCLLITRRAAGLRNHSRQWTLPGGSREPRESAGEAALQELRAETGVAAGPGDVLRILDDYATRYGFLITPVVVWGGPAGNPGPAVVGGGPDPPDPAGRLRRSA
jgi:ADP-ribose pyrophosphatase YjhB (NUDIX family)